MPPQNAQSTQSTALGGGTQSSFRIPSLQQQAVQAQQQAQFASSPQGFLSNFFRSLPQSTARVGRGIFNFGRDVVQGIARSGGSVGLELTRTPELRANPNTRQGQIQQFIFGEEPLESIQTRIERFPQRASQFGIPERVSRNPAFAVPTILGLTAADFIPGGGGGKNAVKAISKFTKADDVARVLRRLRVPEESIEQTAKTLAKTTDTKKINNTIQKLLDKKVAQSTISNIKKSAPRTITKVNKNGDVVQQSFRGDKLDLNPSQIKGIEDRLTALGLDQRKVRSFGDMQKAAEQLGLKNVDDLVREVTNSRITDSEIIALRNTISEQSDQLIRLEQRLAREPNKARVINTQINQVNENINDAVKKLTKGGTEAGRAIAAFRVQAQKTLDPTFWFRRAEKVLDGRDFTVEMKSAILNLIDQGDKQGLANFVSMLRKSSLSEKAVTLWKAGLLTSPTTHLANILGNATMSTLMTASDVASTGLDVLASLATGKRTTTINFATIAAKARGAVEGIKGGGKFFKDGIYPDELLTKYDIPRRVNFKNKIIQGYVDGIFRSLSAEDIIFRQAAMSEALEKEAIVMAKNEGLTGAALRERVSQLLQNPTNSMVANSIDAAEYATFQSKNVLSDIVGDVKRRGGNVSTALEILAPFTKTPTNIANTIVDFSPAGFLRALVRYARPSTRSQRDLVDRLGRSITGTGLITFGTYLAQKGILTGNAPTSPSERADFFAEGKQPHSIKVGENWLRLDRVSPLGNLLALGADFQRLSTDKEGLALTTATAAEALKGLTDQTFLKGISGGLKALTEPERSAERFAQQSLSSTVPSAIGRIARTIDPTLRVPNSVFEAFEARIPLLTEGVAPRMDIFGNEVEAPGGRLNLIDPFASSKVKDSPVIDEAKRLGLTIGLPSKTISGVKMTEHEYAAYQEVQGKVLEQALTSLITSDEYITLSNSEKEKSFARAKRQVREKINDSIFPALMIRRFDLPNDTNPQLLRHLLTELNDNDKFKNAKDEKKGQVLEAIIEQARIR